MTDDAQPHSTRRKLLRACIKLAFQHDTLPHAIILRGVECTDPEARGMGGYADVFDGKFNDAHVALKRFRIFRMAPQSHLDLIKQVRVPFKTCVPTLRVIQQFYRESLLWRVAAHKHILPFYGISEDAFDIPCMVLPWMDRGNIYHHLDNLKENGGLSDSALTSTVDNWVSRIFRATC